MPRKVLAITLVGLLSLSAAAQKRVELGALPACTPQQDKDWTTIQTELAGIDTGDPSTPKVDRFAAGRLGYAGLYLFPYNWLPMSLKKQTMCGRLARFEWNSLFKEQDWNIRIIPSQFFQGVLTDVKRYSPDQSEMYSCDPTPGEDIDRHQCGINSGKKYQENPHNCFEAELTPRKDLFDTLWFRRNTVGNDKRACSTIVDYNLCVYGPFVAEAMHGNRPEIHPLQAIWWRNSQNAGLASPAAQDWTLLHAQDASRRFDQRSDYSPQPDDQELDWAPWAESPRTVDFRVALEVPAKPNTPVSFNADEYYAAGVVTETGQGARTYIASYGGTDVVQLNEKNIDPDHYQVRMEGVCATSASTVRLFLSIRSSIGIEKTPNHPSELGFHAIHLWNASLPPPATPMLPATGMQGINTGLDPQTMLDTQTIYAARRDNHIQMYGQIDQARSPNTSKLLSKSKPVNIDSLLEQDEKIGLFPRILSVRHTTKPDKSDAKTGQLLTGYLGVNAGSISGVQRISDTVLTAAAQFTVTRNGHPGWEDSNEFLYTLNQKIAQAGQSAMVEMLDNVDARPKWSFQGWTCGQHPEQGCAKRSPVGVSMGKPPVMPANVIYVDQDLEGDTPRFHVYFPYWGTYADTLLLLQITGTLTDPTTGELRTTTLSFYNIALPIKNQSDAEVERVIAILAGLIHVAPTKLSSGPVLGIIDPFAQIPRYRQSEMLRLNIKHAAQDELIEPDTMAVFLDAARSLAQQP